MYLWPVRSFSWSWRTFISRTLHHKYPLHWDYFRAWLTNIGYVTLRETKRKTLEEIAASFGDKVIAPEDRGMDGCVVDDEDEGDCGDTKPRVREVEG